MAQSVSTHSSRPVIVINHPTVEELYNFLNDYTPEQIEEFVFAEGLSTIAADTPIYPGDIIIYVDDFSTERANNYIY